MSFTKPPIPLEIIRAFTAGLEDFIDPGDPLYSLLSQESMAIAAYNLLPPIPIPIPMPIPPPPFPEKMEVWDVFATIPSGYRFWAASGDLYGACHVGSINGGTPKLTGFSDVVDVLTAVERFYQLNAIPELAAAAFEPRVLRVPWGRFEAFWLHSTDSTVEDRFVGYSGFPPKGLDDPTKSVCWAEFRNDIWDLARQAYLQAVAKSTAALEAGARAARIRAAGAQALQGQALRLDAAAKEARRALADYASSVSDVSEPEPEPSPGRKPGRKTKKH
jgi:hypothetical protein